jgi:hypothetical protein
MAKEEMSPDPSLVGLAGAVEWMSAWSSSVAPVVALAWGGSRKIA